VNARSGLGVLLAPAMGGPSRGPRAATSIDAGEITRAPDLDLIVPALNESRRIGRTLEAIASELGRSPFAVRVTVVDNGSVDRTVEVVDMARTSGLSLRVISCQAKGKGVAVRTGVAAATAPFVGYVDADQSTPPEALITAMAILLSGWDVVVGSRRAVGAAYAVPQPVIRRLGSRMFNLVACTLVGRMTDTQCGMKLFRTDAVRGIFESVRLGGFAFDVEVIARAKASGLRIMEMPVVWSDSVGSSFRPVRDGLQAFTDLYRLRHCLRADAAGRRHALAPLSLAAIGDVGGGR
jgi:dolichyl-phosphate beta-glucosyltransferase